jgi:hypothetical protein
MIGVAKENACVDVIGEVALGEALNGRLRANRHEDRGFDIPVRGAQDSGAGAREGTFGWISKVIWGIGVGAVFFSRADRSLTVTAECA